MKKILKKKANESTQYKAEKNKIRRELFGVKLKFNEKKLRDIKKVSQKTDSLIQTLRNDLELLDKKIVSLERPLKELKAERIRIGRKKTSLKKLLVRTELSLKKKEELISRIRSTQV